MMKSHVLTEQADVIQMSPVNLISDGLGCKAIQILSTSMQRGRSVFLSCCKLLFIMKSHKLIEQGRCGSNR